MDEWLQVAYKKIEKMPQTALDMRERGKMDLAFFARLVNTGYMYGACLLYTSPSPRDS